VRVAAGDHSQELGSMRDALLSLARLSSLEVVDELPWSPGHARTITSAGIEASVELGSVIDLEAERARLDKQLDELRCEEARAERKLANPDFTAKAPEAIVNKERVRLAEAQAARRKVEAQRAALRV
jgi:valyl-tRNA synthetase